MPENVKVARHRCLSCVRRIRRQIVEEYRLLGRSVEWADLHREACRRYPEEWCLVVTPDTIEEPCELPFCPKCLEVAQSSLQARIRSEKCQDT